MRICLRMFVRLAAVLVGVVATGVVATDLGDIPAIRDMVISNSASLFMTSEAVQTNYTIAIMETNGTLLQITAEDVCGDGTNAIFSYSLSDISNVVRVVCRDASNNGINYWYYFGGNVRFYSEYDEGNLHGYYMKLHTNAEVSLFMNVSNNYFVGTFYEFAEDGSVSQSITASVPQSMIYEDGPL